MQVTTLVHRSSSTEEQNVMARYDFRFRFPNHSVGERGDFGPPKCLVECGPNDSRERFEPKCVRWCTTDRGQFARPLGGRHVL